MAKVKLLTIPALPPEISIVAIWFAWVILNVSGFVESLRVIEGFVAFVKSKLLALILPSTFMLPEDVILVNGWSMLSAETYEDVCAVVTYEAVCAVIT